MATAKKGYKSVKGVKKIQKSTKAKVKGSVKIKTKASDNVFSKVQADLVADIKSRMFQSPSDADKSHVHMESHESEEMGSFFKKMALRCKSCNQAFSKKMELDPLIVEISCPECDEKHIVTFVPASSLFSVHSSSLNIDEGDEEDED